MATMRVLTPLRDQIAREIAAQASELLTTEVGQQYREVVHIEYPDAAWQEEQDRVSEQFDALVEHLGDQFRDKVRALVDELLSFPMEL